MKVLGAIVAMVALGTSVHASTIADVDLGNLTFDVQTAGGTGATGVSNGIGWTLTPSPYLPLTGTNTYEVAGGNYSFDDLHSGMWELSFAQAIGSLLIFAENDNSDNTGIDLGILASDAETFVANGTQYLVGPNAGYLLYEWATPRTTVSNAFFPINGGYDFSFFANAVPANVDAAAVPVPAAGLLLLGGLGGLAALRRRRKS